MSTPRFRLESRAALEGGDGDEGYVLIDTHSATLFACNETAWALLQALKTEVSMDELITRMTTLYDVAEADARSDVFNFLHRLGAIGLIHETK